MFFWEKKKKIIDAEKFEERIELVGAFKAMFERLLVQWETELQNDKKAPKLVLDAAYQEFEKIKSDIQTSLKIIDDKEGFDLFYLFIFQKIKRIFCFKKKKSTSKKLHKQV